MSPYSPLGILLMLVLAVVFGVLGAAAYRGRWTSWQDWSVAGHDVSVLGLPWWSASAALTGLGALGDSILPPVLLKLMALLAVGTWITGAALLVRTPDRLLPQWLRAEGAGPAPGQDETGSPPASAEEDPDTGDQEAGPTGARDAAGYEAAPGDAAQPAEASGATRKTEHPWRGASGASGSHRGRSTT